MINREELQIILNGGRIIDPITGCWNWNKYLVKGYGRIVIDGIKYKVHRLAAYLWKDFDLNSPLFVCHHCDNPKCFNPKHLFVGTHSDNMKDMYKKGRGLTNVARGSRHPKARINEEEVKTIRELASLGVSRRELAKIYGLSYSSLVQVVNGINWKHVK